MLFTITIVSPDLKCITGTGDPKQLYLKQSKHLGENDFLSVLQLQPLASWALF